MFSERKTYRLLRSAALVVPAFAFLVFAQVRVAEADSHMGILRNQVRTPDRQFLHDCLLRLSTVMRSHNEYDEPTFRRIVKLAHSEDNATRCDAFALLWNMGSTSHRKELLKLGHKFATSPNESKAYEGICLLQFFNDSSWKSYALRFKNSDSSIMRSLADEVPRD